MHAIRDLWGKAQRKAPKTGVADPGPEWHPLVYHSLDVAAVARTFLDRSPILSVRVASLLGVDVETARRWVVLLAAWHDMGKWNLGFQSSASARVAMGDDAPKIKTVGQIRRHDSVGQDAIEEIVLPALGWPILLATLFRPATGHHGHPPGARGAARESDPIGRYYPEPVEVAMLKWCRTSVSMLWGEGVPEFDMYGVNLASWLIAGIVVASDWIGSDQHWFPYHAPTLSIDDYWTQIAQPRARRAVAMSGVYEAKRREFPPTTRCIFPYVETTTPLQAHTESAFIEDAPQLWIIEESTGGGKTEAAVTLAARMITRGLGAGMYIALPTMATADAMYARIERVYREVFDGRRPILELAHGRQRQSKTMNPDGSETASSSGTVWFNMHRNAALLSSVGVGTIDQALAAAMSSKWQSVRLVGVARSILVVDEVHACDPYMRRILANLLEFHAALGGSAILLTATLTREMRQDLTSAYHRGLHAKTSRRRRPKPPTLQSDDFPLVTRVSASSVTETRVDSREACYRQIELNRVDSRGDAAQVVINAARDGRSVAWIRNTVDEAIDAYAELTQQGIEAVLLHSRFMYGDRKRIESRLISQLGPSSLPPERYGFVVVSTQVIEQSIDIDFDVMVSDLAPIDLLIQRAGRLHRHQRGDRGPAMLHVLSPDPSDCRSADWLKSSMPMTQLIYGDVPALWRTAKIVDEYDAIRLPGDAREMLGYVFGADAPCPPVLDGLALDSLGDHYAKRSIAASRCLTTSVGYAAQQGWPDDGDRQPTRLGAPTVTLTLCRLVDGQPTPALDAYDRSEITVYARHVSDIDAPKEFDVDGWMQSDDSRPRRHTKPVFLSDDGSAYITNEKGERRRMTYSSSVGLRFEDA